MGKGNFLNNIWFTKSRIAIICMVLMVAGFLLSRVALSISTFLFGVNALWNVPPRKWLQYKWWLMGMAWVGFYALTWFWSSDKGGWGVRLEVKLAVLLLPLAFSLLPKLSLKDIQAFTLITGVMLCGAAFYSVSFFLAEPKHMLWEYQVGHMLHTLPKFDHIRCSLTMALFSIWGIYMFTAFKSKYQKGLLAVILFVIIAYIHILAAKSGLISLYIFIVGYGIFLLFNRRRWYMGIAMLVAIPMVYMFAMKYIPTFRMRKDYVAFSLVVMPNDKTGTYGDIGRLLSYDIAIKLIRQHPFFGVGTGDMLTEMKKGYDVWYPNVPDENRLIPHNQFLTVALGCGIPAMLFFLWWVVAPLALVKRTREGFFFFIVWLILFIQLFIEPMLEVQFGVFVYLFFLLLFRQLVTSEFVTEEGRATKVY